MEPASSVFFGGGTPSLLPPESLASILAAIPLQAGAEVTVECNPETVDVTKLRAYHDAGVTRLSFGVQSMAPHVLAALGRAHDVSSVERAVTAAAAAGFACSYSVDLIFGGAGESVSDWAATVSAVLALETEPGPCQRLWAHGRTGNAAWRPIRSAIPIPTTRLTSMRWPTISLPQPGSTWYEISNWAPPRGRVSPQPVVLGARRVPRYRVCRSFPRG